MANCPAIIISAPASGQGKTTLTAALAHYHTQRGKKVQVFKIGPDFLDPKILQIASQQPVYNLDLFMLGTEQCRQLLYDAATQSDLILIEGVMGLYDGNPSTAHCAIEWQIPVLINIDGAAMAQTFGAIALGLSTFKDITLCGVIANNVNNAYHANLLKNSLPSQLIWWGNIPHLPHQTIPERHLGLSQPHDVPDLLKKIQHLATALPPEATGIPEPSLFNAPSITTLPSLLTSCVIAVAQDEAFSFIYQANIDTLQAMGAKLEFFSPIHDSALPQCTALWLPGGYPEQYLNLLSQNNSMKTSIREHINAQKPTLAECGGMIYLTEFLQNKTENTPLLGILPAHCTLQSKLAAIGHQIALLPQGDIKGHTFHYSTMHTKLIQETQAQSPDGRLGEYIYHVNSLWASYMHFYFASNPLVTASFFLSEPPCLSR